MAGRGLDAVNGAARRPPLRFGPPGDRATPPAVMAPASIGGDTERKFIMFNAANPRRQEVIYRLISMVWATRGQTDHLRALSLIAQIETCVARHYNEDDTIAGNTVHCGDMLKTEQAMYWLLHSEIRQLGIFSATM